jgi:hypothetical protein
LGDSQFLSLPTIQEADVGGESSTYLSALFPGQIKPEKQFILDSGFLPHLGRRDNLSAVLSALILEFLAAKLKKKRKNSKKCKPQISIPKSNRLLLETFTSLCNACLIFCSRVARESAIGGENAAKTEM